jgi:hypothetical protein
VSGYCCEIDEDCGKMRRYVHDMENCLTFGHEYRLIDLGESYWDNGSLARKWNFEKLYNNTKAKQGKHFTVKRKNGRVVVN